MKAALENAKHLAGYTTLRCTIALVQALPMSACDRLSRALAVVVGQWFGMRRRVLDENLQTAFPAWTAAQRKKAAKQMWRHLFLMVCEIAHTPRKVHRTNWRQRCDIPKVETIVRTLVTDRPKVIISGHYGNFELGGYLLGLFGFPTHTVARTIDNPLIDQFVNNFRGRTGQHMLPKHGSRDAIEALLSSGGILTLLGDQAAGEKACWVSFFNRPASTHKAVSLFTLGYEAVTMVVATRRKGNPLEYEIDVAGVVDPQSPDFTQGDSTSLTQWFTDCLEEVIIQAPEQYWWVHRRWKGKPPARVLKRMGR